MDPLSTLSVAGTIVQFVEFGSKLLHDGHGLYKSSSGALTVNQELELITADLQSVLSKLKKSVVFTELPGPISEDDHKDQLSFKDVCDGAASVAEELLERLETLKVKGKKQALNTRILLSLREKIDAQSLSVSALIEHLDNRSQLIISTILEEISVKSSHHQEDQTAKFMQTLAQLLQRVDSSNHNEHSRTRDMILQQARGLVNSYHAPSSFREDEGLVATFEMLSVLPSEELTLRRRAEDVIIQSLRYDKMTHRYEDILEAYPKTFEWIFYDATKAQNPWDSFASWLKSGQGVYWISGKAGSGKSTLMKHIFDDPRTRRYLERWAQKTPLCQASFFFWNSGSKEQKSQIGCLKALLFQIFDKHPDLVSIILPKRWADSYSSSIRRATPSTPPWNLRELIATFRALVQQQKIPITLYILVDGLDEFDGDHEEIVDLFKETTTLKNVKTCLSSRPWVLFRDAFFGCPSLCLQDLTYKDIHLFVNGRFQSNPSFRKLMLLERESAAALVNDIVGKADGVFLWVRLVVKSLLNGLRNHDCVAILQERLRLIPRELNDLYTHLLGLIDPVYLRWASQAFQILRVSRELENYPFGPRENAKNLGIGVLPLTLDVFYFAMDDGFCFNNSQLKPALLETRYQDTEIHLTARCAGLLEVSRTNHKGPVSRGSSVDYFHLTARDYLENGPIWSNILQHTATTNFCPILTMLRAYAGMLWMEPILNNVSYFQSVVRINHNAILPDEQLITSALIYAYHSEKMGVFSNTQATWLDKLDQSLERRKFQRYWGNELFLCNIPRKSADEIPLFESFLCLAVVYQLTWYVEHKLASQPRTISAPRARGLLRLCLPFREREFCAELPNPSPAMVSMLLRHGAKPNARYSGFTPWENTLRLLQILPITHKHVIVGILEVSGLLLRSGAEPKASLNSGSVMSKSAWEIFARLRDDYPELVDPIQVEMARLAPDIVPNADLGPEEDDENASVSEHCVDEVTEFTE